MQVARGARNKGFYRMGEAGWLVDELQPEMGVLFNGRVAENFKLLTGHRGIARNTATEGCFQPSLRWHRAWSSRDTG